MSYVFSKVSKIMNPIKTLSLSLYFKPFNDNAEELLKYVAAKKPLADGSAIQSFALALDEAKGVKFDNWRSFKWVLDYATERGKYTQGMVADFNEQWQKVRKLYPMLQFVDNYTLRKSEHRDTLIEYIKAVDLKIYHDALAKSAASNS
jgi:hypothetical protein